MPLPISKAIIDEAHRNGLKVCAHVFSERDARDLVSVNIDALAHSIRDRRVDPAFADYMAEKGVRLMPTIVREEAAVAFSRKDNPYLSDPFFVTCAWELFETLAVERFTSDPKKADAIKNAFDLAIQNLAVLSNAQVQICLGTDAGFRLKLLGFSQHRELQLMYQAGLTASQALAAAMKNNYEFFAIGASDLSVGQPADFVLVKGDPLTDIRNTTNIHQVWQKGTPTVVEL